MTKKPVVDPEKAVPGRIRKRKVPKKISIFQALYDPGRKLADDLAPKATYNPKDSVSSVVDRPTFQARHFVAKTRNVSATHSTSQKIQQDSISINFEGSSFLDILTAKLRARIYRYVVVDDDHFIYPSLKSGMEQPDLAMTCSKVRDEVLPVFYGENTFAMEIHRAQNSRNRIMNEKWTLMMSYAKHLELLKHVVFVHDSQDISLIPNDSGSSVLPDQTVFISLDIPTSLSTIVPTSYVPRLEMHHHAQCLIAYKHQDNSECTLRENPDIVTKAVVDVVVSSPNYSLNEATDVFDIVTILNDNITAILTARCEPPTSVAERARVVELAEGMCKDMHETDESPGVMETEKRTTVGDAAM